MQRRALFLVLLTMILTAGLFAQATDGILVGTVTDSSGAAVPNAAVTAINKATNIKYATQTSATGDYRINSLPVGQYDVSATAPGFGTATISNVELQLNHTSSVNLTLTVGAVSATVDVTEGTVLLDTSTAQLQNTFDSRQAIEVPSAGISRVLGTSGVYNLSLLGAGVASSGGVGQGVGPSVSGQRPENNSFNIDGVSNDDHYGTGPLIYISNETIAEFNLLQNQFSAEFGGASGGVFNAVSKSGTNALHGSVYEYFQNRDLNAVDQINVLAGQRSLPRFDSNRFGATVGGPIIKDKLFYFGNYEYNPVGQAAQPGQTVSAPTQQGLHTLDGMGLNANNLGIFEKYVPVAPSADSTTTVNGVAIPIGPLSFASPNYNNAYDAVVSIDWNISAKDQVRGRFIYANSTGIDFLAALPVFFQPAPNVSHAGSISEFHNFSPTMENEMRISFNRTNSSTPAGNFAFPGLPAFPNLAFDDLQLQLGPDPNAPSGVIANSFQIQDNITKTIGRHTIKAGYHFLDVILLGNFTQRVRGDYNYVNLEQYLKDMSPTGGNLSGVAGEISGGAGIGGVPFGFLENSAFVNDDFRIRPNLTLNLGIRYEYVTMPVGSRAQQYSAIANVPGVITFDEPKYGPNDWSPRLGFAYSPGKAGVWSIRGGVSRAFDNTYINLNQNASPAYYQSTADVDPAVSTPNFLTNGGLKPSLASTNQSQADARAAVASYTFSGVRPYALTGSLGVQRRVAKDYTVELRYVYTKGVHLWNQTRLNRDTKVTPTEFIPTFMTMPDASTLAGLTTTLADIQGKTSNVLAQYGFPNNITGYHPWGNSRYNGLQFQVNKRFSNNWSYILAYTWSHGFDDSTATNFSTILSPRRAQDFQNLRAEWASSALDRRHRFTFTPVYDFKPFQNGNYLMKNIVGNWNISGTYTFQSPEYATVQSGVDSNQNGDSLDRSIINPAGAFTVGSGVTGYNAAGQVSTDSDIVAYVAKNPNARFIVAGLGALSNSGRNNFPLGHINNFDVAITKRLKLTERFRLDLSAQAFNLFNHAQFIGGYINDVNPFGTASVSRAFLVPSSSDFGHYDQFFSSNSRQMQLVAHFVF